MRKALLVGPILLLVIIVTSCLVTMGHGANVNANVNVKAAENYPITAKVDTKSIEIEYPQTTKADGTPQDAIISGKTTIINDGDKTITYKGVEGPVEQICGTEETQLEPGQKKTIWWRIKIAITLLPRWFGLILFSFECEHKSIDVPATGVEMAIPGFAALLIAAGFLMAKRDTRKRK